MSRFIACLGRSLPTGKCEMCSDYRYKANVPGPKTTRGFDFCIDENGIENVYSSR